MDLTRILCKRCGLVPQAHNNIPHKPDYEFIERL